jgi:translocation protein SEC63
MNALKTGGLAGAPPKRSRKHTPVESSDDESDTDGQAGEDTSETDTDTDTDGE